MRSTRVRVGWGSEIGRIKIVFACNPDQGELVESETTLTAANDLAIRHALQAAGVEFIDENGGGPGVRLRRSKAEKKT